MRRLEPVRLKPWTLPLIVGAIAVPIVAGFALVGPELGLAVGALAATAILVLAAKARFDEPIEVAPPPDDRFTMLVVVTSPLDDPHVAATIAEIADAGGRATRPHAARDPEILVLAPALNTGVAHWLSDLRRARFEAQRRLTLAVATLATAGLEARGEVGDSDTVQAVEDTLRTFPAQEVVFVTDRVHDGEVEDVQRRLDRPVRLLEAPKAVPERQPSR